ncbi:MAG: BrnT family toxin [Acidobacteriota bacterium]
MVVEWDEKKNLRNQQKHRASFEEAATVFTDPLEVTINDPDHTLSERRFISIGQSFRHRLLVVSYVERGNKIRIISARKPTISERRAYEEKK